MAGWSPVAVIPRTAIASGVEDIDQFARGAVAGQAEEDFLEALPVAGGAPPG